MDFGGLVIITGSFGLSGSIGNAFSFVQTSCIVLKHINYAQ